ncbi:type II toxin-antitoxin system PemK/MazF family toxin [Defluviimonas aestuarii]|uniref:type II toxin-antitoxin system PemK/MazF family toxin n=1 Tax=Albidovulum aestuarii TaxID=1130726 RepID=UPI00249A5D3C|nr:type II toxin-antitoxin system PemK/MazF family toxin [Defluviimonas aestuarii]MDI3336397.1 type II toxin-antitoxin system PemK/MazF family toxin [Defluviimonas aestuarii]
MPISFHPRAGQILMCDFRGFQVPEMVKVRPVMIISPRLPYRGDIAAIVPLSLTAPLHNLPFNVRLSRNYNPLEADDLPVWAKCDMLMNLSIRRLEGFKVGRRKWETPQATGEDLKAVRAGILAALGFAAGGE